MKKYTLTDKDRKALETYKDRWIENAMSTEAMTSEDREQTRVAIKGMYEAAGLTPPPDNRIVFVPSPFVLRFAGGFAAAIWNLKGERGTVRNATWDATSAATSVATWAGTRAATIEATAKATIEATAKATSAATRDATEAATRAATGAATSEATIEATAKATSAATRYATWAATRDATWVATEAATEAATRAATADATWDATSGATWDATKEATRAVVRNATITATMEATRAATADTTMDEVDEVVWCAVSEATADATSVAIAAATNAATWKAKWGAVDDATADATSAATRDATREATGDVLDRFYSLDVSSMVGLADYLGLGEFGLECADKSYSMWNGGNQWSAYCSFLSFFRDVAKLPIDYSKYEFYEKACLHSGPRIMHKEFCIVSDRPEVLLEDSENRPHCSTGPFCKWRDGSAIYAYHGTHVPAWVIEKPELITIEEIFKEDNAEVRRVMTEIYGFGKFGEDIIKSGKATLKSEEEVWGEPVKYYHYNDDEVTMGFIHVINGTIEKDGTKHEFILSVKADNKTARDAVYSTYPELMKRLENMPNPMKILQQSIRS